MQADENERVGFTCAYTPVALIDAAGLVPFRVLPVGDAPDRAGSLLHDNMCPHIKRVLDRVLAGDVPDLAGVVLMDSCDAMRRLADAWGAARPAERVVFLDLPVNCDDRSVAYFRKELDRLVGQLCEWSGRQVTADVVTRSVERYNDLASRLALLAERAADGALPGGRKALQEILDRSVTQPVAESLAELKRIDDEPDVPQDTDARTPVFLFGNVLPGPEPFELLEACGCRVVGDDVCTGSRQLVPMTIKGTEDVMTQLARAVLSRPPCARTVDASQPGQLAEQVRARAKACGAKGVVAHVMKFCDPYLARLPAVRESLQEAGLPLLVLEGDCTLRSLGQQRTRVEAFVEMLGG